MKKVLTLAVLLLTALLLCCACGETEEVQNLVPFPIGGYQLVRPEEAAADTVAHAVTLYKELSAQGSDIRLTTDFLNERKGEVAPANELLFGLTGRQESADANAEHAPGRFTYLIKIVGTKLVILAGSDYAYGLAADYLLDSYDASSGAFMIPDGCYIGTWDPPLKELSIDGVPISQFTIVADNFPGWNIPSLAQALSDTISNISGYVLPVITDEDEPAEHEIHITTAATIRELPFDTDNAVFGIYDGDLYLYATSRAELQELFDRMNAACFSEASALEVKTSAASVKLFDYKEEIISVKPGEGALEAAFKTASDKMKAATADSPVSVVLELEGGSYPIDTTLGITGQNTTPFGKLTVRAAGKDSPVISAFTDLDPAGFTKVEGKDYYFYQFKADEKGKYPVFHDFFDGGQAIPIASGERFVTHTNYENPDDRLDPENLKGIYVERRAVEALGDITFPTEFTIYVQWQAAILHAVGVDYADTKTVDGYELVRLKIEEEELISFLSGVNDSLGINNRTCFLSNHISLLKPNSWVYDSTTGKLYYYPENGAPKAPAYSDQPILFRLVDTPVVTFEGITFTGTGCAFPAADGYISGQANADKRRGVPQAAAILIENGSNVTVRDCTFLELGTNGIQSVTNLSGIEIRGCTFDDISMSAICLGLHSKSWEGNSAMCNIVIEDNSLNNIAMEYPTAPAIYINKVDNLKLMHNTISNTAYSAISVGWGWSTVTYDYGESINVRRAEIAYNRITDFMQLLNDGAAIYVLGGNVKIEHTDYFNFMHDNYAERAASSNSTRRGYYMDGSSSNWEVYDSVCVGSAMPVFSQFHVKSQYTHNNYIHDIYTTHAVDTGNHAPSRTTILGDTFVVAAGKDALFDKYPKAKEIYEASGCR